MPTARKPSLVYLITRAHVCYRSCWAHSTVEAIESAWAIGGHDLTSFSVQQLTACDTSSDDDGCNGGDPPSAYDYIIDAGGLATEATCESLTPDVHVSSLAVSPSPPLTLAYSQCTGALPRSLR